MNNKLTDERVSNATLIRLIQWADQHNSHYVAAALCELQERRRLDGILYAVCEVCGVPCNNPNHPQMAVAHEYSAQPVPVVSFYRDGIEAAASWVDKQRQAFDNEHGRYDSDTGAFEFGNDAQRDYSDTLAELADGIRGLHPNAGDNSPVTQDGWISCNERMPDNDESKPIAIFTGKCLGQGMFVATYDDDGFFDYWEGMEIIGVTHWMPLPEPPQQ
ncbi:DUF551 domain-containing protein [Salmonella enterica]|nr:DUF551 domain-containing protein [Salmonella enterica]